MRIKVNLFGKNVILPIANQHLVNSYFHTCVGRNNIYHDAKSNYSLSNLNGGKLNSDNKTITIDKHCYFIITTNDDVLINCIINGLKNNRDFGYGLQFGFTDIISEEFFNGWNYFKTLSPILIKEYESKSKYSFKTIQNCENYSKFITNYLINKLSKIDPTLNLDDFNVIVEPDFKFNKVRKILIKNVINHATQCQLNVFTNKKVAETLYTYGIGQSTGCGFGTIYKTENKQIYR